MNKKKTSIPYDTLGVLFIRLWDRIEIPNAPWFIFGEPTPKELAQFLRSSSYSDELFQTGVLFSAQVYKSNAVAGEVKSISIEGIGSSPTKAMLNSMVGASTDTVETLNDKADEYFKEHLGGPEKDGYVRVAEKDIGFFLKLNENGKWIVNRDVIDLDMETMRRVARSEYIAILETTDIRSRKEIIKAAQQQRVFEDIGDQFGRQIRERRLDAKLAKSSELRREALRNLDKAAALHRKAAKWSRVARGISIVSSLLQVASSAAAKAQAEKANAARIAENKRIVDGLSLLSNQSDLQAAKAAADVAYLASEITGAVANANKRLDEIVEVLRFVLPRLPLPTEPQNAEKIIDESLDEPEFGGLP